MPTNLMLLLPKLIQYACAAATLIFLVQLWRMTRHAGFGVLALVLLIGCLQAIVVPFLVRMPFATSLRMIFAISAALMALVTALAWWRIFLWFKQSYAQDPHV